MQSLWPFGWRPEAREASKENGIVNLRISRRKLMQTAGIAAFASSASAAGDMPALRFEGKDTPKIALSIGDGRGGGFGGGGAGAGVGAPGGEQGAPQGATPGGTAPVP